MQHVEVERRFAASPDAVFAVYTDHARWKEWAGFPGSSLEKEGSPDRNGVGAVRILGAGPGQVAEEVLEFEPGKRMRYRVVRGAVPIRNHRGEVLFEPDGDGTRVIWRCQFEPKWNVPGLGPLLRAVFTRVFARALAGLERHSFPRS